MKACLETWPSAEEDTRRSQKIWNEQNGNLIYYWNRCYLGALCVTRVFEDDGATEDIRAGIIWKELRGEDYPEMEVLIISPTESYWNMPWSTLQGNLLVISFEVAKTELGIDVCLSVFCLFSVSVSVSRR